MYYRWLFVLLIITPLLACAQGVENISISELKVLMAEGVTVIDVRTPQEWDQTGIVEGSKPIMFFDGKRQAHPEAWMQQAVAHISPDEKVAIICRSGRRSKTVGEFLMKEHGYQYVYNVKGGILKWLGTGNPTVKPN